MPARPPHPAEDQDHRSSLRLLTAAAMLRTGRQPLAVAQTTKVPLALVQLLAEQPSPTSSTVGDTPVSATTPWQQHRQRRRRHRALLLVGAAIANSCIAIAINLDRHPALAVGCGATALLLTAALHRLARRTPAASKPGPHT